MNEMKRALESAHRRAGRPPRDPERIERITKLLAERWKRDPDQRLGQLIVNVSRHEIEGPFAGNDDPWFAEDDAWEAALKRRSE